jgi:putative ABC transport system substrate-binding protein
MKLPFGSSRRGLFVSFACGLLAAGALVAPVRAQPVVAITQIVEHPALDAMRKGVLDGLKELGFEDGRNMRVQFQSAQGSQVTAAQIGQKFAGDRPAVIVALSTPSAQTIVATNKQVPVVFGAVTDPLGTKLVSNLQRPGANVTGMSAFPPVPQQVDLLAELVPTMKRMGIVYNSGEANSVAIVAAVKKYLEGKPLQLVETTVTRSAEVGQAVESLVGKVDAILIPGDNTVLSTFEAVLRVTQPAKLVTVCGDPTAAQRGCTAGLGYNWYTGGRELAERVAAVLKGKAPGEIPVEPASQVELILSQKSADVMGFRFPDKVMQRATSVVK